MGGRDKRRKRTAETVRLIAHSNAALRGNTSGGADRAGGDQGAAFLLRSVPTKRHCACRTPNQRTVRASPGLPWPRLAPERPTVLPNVHDALNSLAQRHRRRQCPLARRVRNEGLQALKLRVGQDAPRPGWRVLLAERGSQPQGTLLLPQTNSIVHEGPALRLPTPRTRASRGQPACGCGKRQPRGRGDARQGERNPLRAGKHRPWGASPTSGGGHSAEAGALNSGAAALRANEWPESGKRAPCWARGTLARRTDLPAEPKAHSPEPWFPANGRRDRCGRRRLGRCWHWSGWDTVELEFAATRGTCTLVPGAP